MVEINWNPSRRELNIFGGLLVPFAGLVGWMWYRRTGDLLLPTVLMTTACMLAATGLVFPRALRGVYVAWMLAAYPTGWLLSHLILGAVYYLAVTPWALFMRLCGRDPLARRFLPEAATYWTRREPPRPVASYFRQF